MPTTNNKALFPIPNAPCSQVYSSSEKSCVPHWSTKLCIAPGDLMFSVAQQREPGGTQEEQQGGEIMGTF